METSTEKQSEAIEKLDQLDEFILEVDNEPLILEKHKQFRQNITYKPRPDHLNEILVLDEELPIMRYTGTSNQSEKDWSVSNLNTDKL